MQIENILRKHKNSIHPVFKPELNNENTLIMDFSNSNTELRNIDVDNTALINEYIFNIIKSSNCLYGYGGYLEDRDVYKRSPLFADGDQHRTIHLGVDVWTPADTPFYFPLDGKIHSFNNNETYGDYGPTIITEHVLDDTKFYLLFGHLSMVSIKNLKPGQPIKGGEQGGKVGKPEENGNWPPHLHFQVISNLMDKKGDFPGTASPGNFDEFKAICHDPDVFFNLNCARS